MSGLPEDRRAFDIRGRRNGMNKDHDNMLGALPSKVYVSIPLLILISLQPLKLDERLFTALLLLLDRE